MNTTKQPYEAPTFHCNGDVVQHTRNHLFKNTEPDTTPQSAMGSVGFGV
jgi:hypothetical protein